ncbi:MAG: DUF2254 domain-containing protein [Actinomycetota bacterium]|nr:DUF2254 domain-containing protein [Actinomycetota bacterium]
MKLGVRVGAIVEYLRGALWFLPSVTVLTAFVVGNVLTGVRVAPDSSLAAWVYGGGADGARGVLEAVAGSVITVTGVVFSLTVVTLQLASSQFSPRLLRTFLRDPANQIVLSVFLSTFAYSLTVLRVIRTGATPDADFVPQLAVTGGLVLATASVAALVYFIHHISVELRVDKMMSDVETDTLDTIHNVYRRVVQRGRCALPDVPDHAVAVRAGHSGIVQAVAPDSLFDDAVDRGLVVRVAPRVGERVVAGGTIAWCWTVDRDAPPPDLDDVSAFVNDAVQVGFERTLQQDVVFGLRQLVDVAAKALSPGINDPTTAVDAVGHLAALLTVLAERDLEPVLRHDDQGTVRLALDRPRLGDYLDTACGQIRRYGAREPAVLIALLWMLGEVDARCRSDEHHRQVAAQAALIVAAAERAIDEPCDVETVRNAAAALGNGGRGERHTAVTAAERAAAATTGAGRT